ncbi:MAG: lytic transglycosylase domain-containing protein [Sphingomicrobium sp.]
MILKPVLCAALLTFAASAPVRAQVIEIDSSGQAQTYDGPTVFTGTESIAIEPARRATGMSGNPAGLIADAARNHGLAPGLLEALAWQESRGRMSAVSPKGALGVMQLMPATAAELGVRPLDLGDNIRGGALYLRRQLDRFGGSVPLALAAYNAGPGAVSRYRGIPPYRETRSYVANILARWRPGVSTGPANLTIVEVTP